MILFSETLDIFDKISYKNGDENYPNRINRKTVNDPKMSSDLDRTPNLATFSQTSNQFLLKLVTLKYINPNDNFSLVVHGYAQLMTYLMQLSMALQSIF
jgi:hypothetical protein